MAKRNLKSGFTLMELLVYSALIGVIVVIAGEAFSSSTKFRIRTESMVKSTSWANEISTILGEDLVQMGSKVALEGTEYNFYNQAYNDADSDSSSYFLKDTKDSIAFRRVVYSDEGKALFAQQISWYAKQDSLFRKCRTLTKFEDVEPDADCPVSEDPNPVLMTWNLERFSIRPGKRIQDASTCISTSFDKGCFKRGSVYTLASRSAMNVTPVVTESVGGGSSVAIKGFYSNYGYNSNYSSEVYLLNGTPSSPSWDQCSPFTFKPNITYGVSFSLAVMSDITNVNYMRNFQAEYDHVSVGFRTAAGERIPGVEDHMVYPAQGDLDSDRYFEFSFPREVTGACLTLTFAFFSSHAAEGSLELAGLSVFPRDEAGYDFDSPGSDTRMHKAFEYTLGIKVSGETSTIKKFVPTPNNGI